VSVNQPIVYYAEGSASVYRVIEIQRKKQRPQLVLHRSTVRSRNFYIFNGL